MQTSLSGEVLSVQAAAEASGALFPAGHLFQEGTMGRQGNCSKGFGQDIKQVLDVRHLGQGEILVSP